MSLTPKDCSGTDPEQLFTQQELSIMQYSSFHDLGSISGMMINKLERERLATELAIATIARECSLDEETVCSCLKSIQAKLADLKKLGESEYREVLQKLSNLLEDRESLQSDQELTKRETEIFCRAALGDELDEIASKLDLATERVEVSLKRVLQKLEAKNLVDAIHKASQKGLIDTYGLFGLTEGYRHYTEDPNWEPGCMGPGYY